MHVYVNRENMNRGRHVFYPPRKRHLSELFANGYGDALQFVKENRLTWCNLMCYGTSWLKQFPNECRQAKLKLSQWPIRTKIIIIISQWGLKIRMWGRGSKGRALGARITVRMDPSPTLLGSSVNDFECFGRETKIVNWLQFSIFQFLDFRRKQKN